MDEKESQEELAKRMRDAASQVTVGARYMHHKQMTYKVVALALREEDNVPCVIYRAEYGESLVWIRPVAMWNETVEYKGKMVKRFTKVN